MDKELQLSKEAANFAEVAEKLLLQREQLRTREKNLRDQKEALQLRAHSLEQGEEQIRQRELRLQESEKKVENQLARFRQAIQISDPSQSQESGSQRHFPVPFFQTNFQSSMNGPEEMVQQKFESIRPASDHLRKQHEEITQQKLESIKAEDREFQELIRMTLPSQQTEPQF